MKSEQKYRALLQKLKNYKWIFVMKFVLFIRALLRNGELIKGVLFVCFVVMLFYFYILGFCCFLGGARHRNARAIVFTNRQNKSLISVDRRTSLLSHVQYSVLYQSRLQRIYRSQCPKGDEYGVGPKPIATREHRDR